MMRKIELIRVTFLSLCIAIISAKVDPCGKCSFDMYPEVQGVGYNASGYVWHLSFNWTSQEAVFIDIDKQWAKLYDFKNHILIEAATDITGAKHHKKDCLYSKIDKSLKMPIMDSSIDNVKPNQSCDGLQRSDTYEDQSTGYNVTITSEEITMGHQEDETGRIMCEKVVGDLIHISPGKNLVTKYILYPAIWFVRSSFKTNHYKSECKGWKEFIKSHSKLETQSLKKIP